MKKYLDPDTIRQEVEDIIDYFSDEDGCIVDGDEDLICELNDLLDRPMVICYPEHLYLVSYLIIETMLEMVHNVQTPMTARFINELLDTMYDVIREVDEAKEDLFDFLMDELTGEEDEFTLNLLMRDFLDDDHIRELTRYLMMRIDEIEADNCSGVIEAYEMDHLLLLLKHQDQDIMAYMQDHFDFAACRLGIASVLIEEGAFDLAQEIIEDLCHELLSQDTYHRLLKLKIKLQYCSHYN